MIMSLLLVGSVPCGRLETFGALPDDFGVFRVIRRHSADKISPQTDIPWLLSRVMHGNLAICSAPL